MRSVSILQVGGQLIRVSLHITRRNSATLVKKGEVDRQQPWNDFDINYPLAATSMFYCGVLVFWCSGALAIRGEDQKRHIANSEAQTRNP